MEPKVALDQKKHAKRNQEGPGGVRRFQARCPGRLFGALWCQTGSMLAQFLPLYRKKCIQKTMQKSTPKKQRKRMQRNTKTYAETLAMIAVGLVVVGDRFVGLAGGGIEN